MGMGGNLELFYNFAMFNKVNFYNPIYNHFSYIRMSHPDMS